MITARVISKWLESDPLGTTPNKKARRPALWEDHPPRIFVNVTGQPVTSMPSKVSVVVIEGQWNESDFSALQADPNYSGTILWTEATRNDSVQQSDLDGLNAALQRFGAGTAELSQAINTSAATKNDLASSLIGWIAVQPKTAVIQIG